LKLRRGQWAAVPDLGLSHALDPGMPAIEAERAESTYTSVHRVLTAIHGRNFNLDVLRGVAILLVVLHHLGVPVFRTGGWIGVDLFFVLSGFLISGLLFREWKETGTINIGRFYARRGFKIYPAFWALMAVTLAVNYWTPGIPSFPVTGRSIMAELSFTQNYWRAIWGQTWSLAVEEHFYLLLPLLLWLLQRRDPKNPFRLLPTAFAVTALLELGLRVATTWRLNIVAFEPLM
jgi:peptidoglycan/LPS O-acetylase OafA/YrhL